MSSGCHWALQVAFEEAVLSCGARYECIVCKQLVGIILFVFVRQDLMPFVSSVVRLKLPPSTNTPLNTFHPSRDPSTGWRCHSTGAGGANQLKYCQGHVSPVNVCMYS